MSNQTLRNKGLWVAILLSSVVHALVFRKTEVQLPESAKPRTLEISLSSQDIKELRPSPAAINAGSQENMLEKSSEEITHPTEKLLMLNNLALDNKENKAEDSSKNQSNTNAEIQEVYAPLPPFIASSPSFNINITYNTTLSTNRSSLEITSHFEMDENSMYKIRVNPTENSNTSNFFIEIQGRLFKQSLGPALYLMRGDLASKMFRLGDISLPNQTSGRSPDNILDQQSLIYYFMFFPPTSADRVIMLSDGTNINSYTARTLGMAFLKSPHFGELRTIKVNLQNDSNNERIELWLAPDYRYLPLKIIHTDINNIFIEQQASGISMQ